MKREETLFKNTLIVAIGQICTKFINFFLLPLYTAVLTTEEYGIVDLLNTYISLIIPLAFFQMNQSIFRHLIDVRQDDNEKKKFITTCLCTVLIQSVLYLIVYLFVSMFISNEYKYFLATNVVATMLSDILLQITRGLGDNKTYSEGCIISGAGTFILNIFLIVVFKFGAYGILISTLIANILCSFFIFWKKKIYKYISFNYFKGSYLKKLWKYSIPLVPNQVSWWIINISDRTIITYVLGVAVNGIYSAANKFSAICTALFNIFNMTWSESASLHINDKDSSKFFSNIVNITIKMFVSLCFGMIAVMPFGFKYLITGEGFSDAYYQIPILLIATIFNIIVSLLGSIYVALKKSNEIAKTSIYSAIINIVTNIIMIRFIGLYAASLSTLIAFLLMSIYRFIDVQKYVKIKLEKKFLVVSILIMPIILITYYLKNNVLSILSLLLTIIFAIYFNKDNFSSVIKMIKKRNSMFRKCDIKNFTNI